jgi:dual specificity tyrosine-phosphorylation-regulated kinase 2/3/4
MAATMAIPSNTTKIKQLFEDSPPSKDQSALPSISLRPNSAARTATVKPTPAFTNGVSSSATASSSSSSTQSSSALGPLTPAQAQLKYRKVLTSFEQTEIENYPQVYFVGPTARKVSASKTTTNPNNGFDDENGRYKSVKNDHLAYRYEVVKGLGKGSFGDVVKVYDHKTKQHSAVKIIRNEPRFHKQAQSEVKILELLKKQDTKNKNNVIHMLDYFLFRNHLCIAFELLHTDLYSALKKDGFKGFSVDEVRGFTDKIVNCLRMLRRNRIIHCDLKPENIILKSKDSLDIKVIDFGSSCEDAQKVHTYIQSRFYRSPEIILGSSYGMPIDMWSLGCILAELYTGHPLFPGRDEKEQLMYQMEILGAPPPALLQKCKRAANFFDSFGNPRHTIDRRGTARMPGTRSLAKALNCSDPGLVSFISSCLAWDPEQRMTPKDAASHPFVQRLLHNPLRSLVPSSSTHSSSRAASVATTGTSRTASAATVVIPSGLSAAKLVTSATATKPAAVATSNSSGSISVATLGANLPSTVAGQRTKITVAAAFP